MDVRRKPAAARGPHAGGATGAGPRATRLLLVRHAETTASRAGVYLGWGDAPLTPEGEAAARALGAALPRPDLVFASDLPRALRTARLALPGMRALPDSRLRELDFGAFEGRTYAENLEAHGESFRGWLADPRRARPPGHPLRTQRVGGERLDELEMRVADWLEALPDRGTVIAFLHGGSLRAALARLDGRTTEELLPLRVEPCDVVEREVRRAP